MSSNTSLRRQRTCYRANFTRCYNKIMKLVNESDEPIATDRLIFEHDYLYKKYTELECLDRQLFELESDSEIPQEDLIEAFEEDSDILKGNLDKIFEIKSIIKSQSVADEDTLPVTSIEKPVASSVPVTMSGTTYNAKLPKLNLIHFDGSDVTRWSEFYDVFRCEIDARKDIDEVTKFRYLLSLLHGTAKDRIRYYRPTGTNYKLALEKLRSEFGDQQRIMNALIESLNAASLSDDSASELRRFHDRIAFDIGSLTQYGFNTMDYGPFLIPSLISKLPQALQIKLLDKTKGSYPSLDEFVAFLGIEVRKLEEIASLNKSHEHVSLYSEHSASDYHPISTVTMTHSHNSMKSDRSDRFKSFKPRVVKRCAFCNRDEHNTNSCTLDYSSKLNIIKAKKLCYNCLGSHLKRDCTSKNRCAKCGRSHHTSIHRQIQYPRSNVVSENTSSPQEPFRENNGSPHSHKVTTSIAHVDFQTESVGQTVPQTDSCKMSPIAHLQEDKRVKDIPTVLLKTAQSVICTGDEKFPVKVLIDEGSQASFIKQSIADQLRLPIIKRFFIKSHAFASKKPVTTSCNLVNFNMKTMDEVINVNALSISQIVTIDRTGWSDCQQLSCLKDTQLADTFDATEFDVDILVGADLAWMFLKSEMKIIDPSGLSIQDSSLGTLLSGPLHRDDSHVHQTDNCASCLLNVHSMNECFELVPSLSFHSRQPSKETSSLSKYPIEMNPTDSYDIHVTTNNEFHTNYCNSIEFDETERQYLVSLPWLEDHSSLPSNLKASRSRLLQVTGRLLEMKLFDAYANVIKEHLARGYVEEVPSDQEMFKEKNCHYLPHFFVLKENSPTTPLRIVFDASSGRTSLNDCLETGPCLLNDLSDILLRFRIPKYAFCADIEKAFLSIQVKEDDRNFLRFLWYKHHDPNSEIISLRYRCLTFGPTCSPYILNAVLRFHLQNQKSEVANDMSDRIYVDNLASGCDTEERAIEYFNEARSMLQDAGMNLRQWLSNSQAVQQLARDSNVSHKSQQISVLGLSWKSDTDTLNFPNKAPPTDFSELDFTKRSALSQASSLFDPYGFASPVTMPLKSFMSKVMNQSTSWDEILSDELKSEFIALMAEVTQIRVHFSVPRHLQINTDDDIQIHLFCDASFSAMAAVVYFVQNAHSILVSSKYKIVPMNKKQSWTIPRLELSAMLLGSRLVTEILRAYHKDIKSYSLHAWTDSEICLHWLKGEKNKRQKIFVANRVKQIKLLVPPELWSHVSSEENAADIITKGCSAEALIASKKWLQGPSWLPLTNKWPRWNYEKTEITTSVMAADQQEHSGLSVLIDENRFGSYIKLLRCMVLVLRFITKLKHRILHTRPEDTRLIQHSRPTGEDIRYAELKLIQLLQKEKFREEYDYLEKEHNGKKPSLVHALNLILKDKVIHAAGRLQTCTIERDSKLPVLLPKDNHVTTLIIRYFHDQVHHAGVPTTVTAMRQRFWLPSARSQCQKVLRKCTICRRFNSRPFRLPTPPDLPDFRVNDVRPFTSIGVDFSGSLTVRSGPHSFTKCYICIFSCCTTRNINLELISDMTTESFLLALRSHCADYTMPRLIISDNAKTFKKADLEIQKLFSLVWNSETENFLNQKQISRKTWSEIRFANIPVKAPWWGGFYERFVGIVKMCLKKVLGRACISFEQLRVLLKEIKSTLNNRPLTAIDSSSDGGDAITPSHLLFGFHSDSIPYPHVELEEIERSTFFNDPQSLNRMAIHRSLLYNHYVKRFQQEYFAALRERHFYQQRSSDSHRPSFPTVGELVLIHDDVLPRLRWRVAVVEKLISGVDGKVRAAHLRTTSGKTNRALSKLYPLEITSTESRDVNSSSSNSTEEETTAQCQVNRPPRRAAAEAALRGLQALTRSAEQAEVGP